MDYYGYFPTFNYLIVEAQLIATLIGFQAILFIFWYREKIRRKAFDGKKQLTKKEKAILRFVAIVFLWIILMGCSILIEHADTLYQLPKTIEEVLAHNMSIPYAVEDRLDSSHESFIFWTILSFMYIGFLVISLDIFDFLKSHTKIEPTKEKKKTKKKPAKKEKKKAEKKPKASTKKKKRNVKKKKKSGGK